MNCKYSQNPNLWLNEQIAQSQTSCSILINGWWFSAGKQSSKIYGLISQVLPSRPPLPETSGLSYSEPGQLCMKVQRTLADNFTQEEIPPEVLEKLKFKVAKEEILKINNYPESKGIRLAQPVQRPNLMKIGVIYSAVGLADRRQVVYSKQRFNNEKDLAYLYTSPLDYHKMPVSFSSLFSFYRKWSMFREVKPSTPGNTSGNKRSMGLKPYLLSPTAILFPEPPTMSLKKVHFLN